MIIGNEFIEVFAEAARWSRFEFCSRTRFAKNGLEGKVWQYFTVVPGINRVLYDFTPKPTGTVEFE